MKNENYRWGGKSESVEWKIRSEIVIFKQNVTLGHHSQLLVVVVALMIRSYWPENQS